MVTQVPIMVYDLFVFHSQIGAMGALIQHLGEGGGEQRGGRGGEEEGEAGEAGTKS
jgi:hypothetical protein